MFDRQKIAADFSRSAAQYAQHASLQKRVGMALIEASTPYVRNYSRLLDVGAGSGELTVLWSCVDKTALDMAEGMCEQARLHGLKAICAPAETLPLADASTDVVTSNVMLQWLENPSLFFGQAQRVLAAQGYLCITHFSQGTLAELGAAFKTVTGDSSISPFLSHEEMQNKVSDAGFEIVFSQEQVYVESYDNLDALFAYLRAIGANNKLHSRKRGLLTPRKLAAIRMAYPASAQGITATWQVGFLIARKI